MCHVAVVEVDPESGKIESIDYAAVNDAGTMVNPKTLGGHIPGGQANGIGSVLFEEIARRNGQFQTTILLGPLPTVREMRKKLLKMSDI